jgi:hypothetical protein
MRSKVLEDVIADLVSRWPISEIARTTLASGAPVCALRFPRPRDEFLRDLAAQVETKPIYVIEFDPPVHFGTALPSATVSPHDWVFLILLTPNSTRSDRLKIFAALTRTPWWLDSSTNSAHGVA